MVEFKEGDKVFIRWMGGNSGIYKLHQGKYNRWYVYMNTSAGEEVNYNAGEVFVDTERVELV